MAGIRLSLQLSVDGLNGIADFVLEAADCVLLQRIPALAPFSDKLILGRPDALQNVERILPAGIEFRQRFI
jgi:hypothetical protein